MQIISDLKNIPDCAIALGNFDGLHIAHTKILNECIAYAEKISLKSGVLLFENHTGTITENCNIKVLTPHKEKLEIISGLGLDFAFVKTFDKHFMELSPREFFDFLINKLNVKAVFAGFDYTFGYKASGNADLLKAFGNEKNIDINIIKEVDIDTIPVSSTLIRNMITEGKVDAAAKFLGRYYEISGNVVYGKQNGRKLGLPTANVEYDKDKLLPSDGVYAGYLTVGDSKYKCLINIGKNPTFNADIRTIEAHIADFSGDLYGKFVTIQFTKKIREEKKFNSPEELRLQIESDLISSGVKKPDKN